MAAPAGGKHLEEQELNFAWCLEQGCTPGVLCTQGSSPPPGTQRRAGSGSCASDAARWEGENLGF